MVSSEGDKFHVHKSHVCSWSDYLNAALLGPLGDSNKETIHLEELSAAVSISDYLHNIHIQNKLRKICNGQLKWEHWFIT